jgi:tetratricopeptide (TPR) repeat protein
MLLTKKTNPRKANENEEVLTMIIHKLCSCGKLILTVVVFALAVTAQTSQLGKVDFPNSGSAEAQEHFLRGVAALHSFWYEEALLAFREARTADPEFMLAYWGEAMSHNHPLWGEQNTAAAREVIAKIKDSPKLTPRERAYLNAVKLLYSDEEKRTRDEKYSAAMEQLYLQYPNDLEAAAFYSLSLLGLVRPEEKSYRLQAKAGAIALAVYQKNPNHPGAAHYIIHAFDDPEHAILALPAARRYAQIAPEAHHARHMPSHIFLQLGMWPEAAASNEAAWEASETWMKRKNLSLSVRDYHSLHWLLYVYLQQGRYQKAEQLLSLMKQTMADTTYENKLRPGYYQNNYANMAAAFIVETERWQLATKLLPATTSEAAAAPAAGHGAHGTAPALAMSGTAILRTSSSGQRLPVFIHGLARASMGEMANDSDSNMSPGDIEELEVSALMASSKGDHEKAISLMREAVKLEEALGAPSGPPNLIKPTHELFGEILLRAGKAPEAAEQFNNALLRQPNRARSLLGAARAAVKMGDEPAARALYSRLLTQWQQADEGLPELQEVKTYLGRKVSGQRGRKSEVTAGGSLWAL